MKNLFQLASRFLKETGLFAEKLFQNKREILVGSLDRLQKYPFFKETLSPCVKTLFVAYVKFTVNLVHYTVATRLGYALTILCFFFGVLCGPLEVNTPLYICQWIAFYYSILVFFSTCIVPLIFYVTPLRTFLYERLGKDYVISRVGD